MQNVFVLAAADTGGLAGLASMALPLILMFGLMWLLMIRPQKKKEKALRELVNSMVVGDHILTIGGVIGRIVNIRDDEVTISTSVANTLITFKKSAISSVTKPVAE
jgi:preprotein translocase subunit YajC